MTVEINNFLLFNPANEKTDKNDVSYSLYGTNSFNLVWEKVCADNFGSVLDKKIVDLPLSNQE